MRTPEFRRLPRASGFTLVELMTVVVIIGIVSFLAVRITSRAGRGERAPAFARSVLSAVHRARQAALVDAVFARVTLSSSQVKTELLQSENHSCSTNGDCASGFTCSSSVCVCSSNANCRSGFSCTSGMCVMPLDGTDPTGSGIEMCDPVEGSTTTSWLSGYTLGGGSSPVCPTTATTTILFGKGACTTVTANKSAFACISGSTSAGATMYFRALNDEKHYRLAIWGLTGLPRLVDQ